VNEEDRLEWARLRWDQAGWRQHWLLMWGFIGQQYLSDYRWKRLYRNNPLRIRRE